MFESRPRHMPFKDRARQRAYQREWWARRRAEFFRDKACALCGATDDLVLHHRDPAQKVSHRIWSWARERLQAELAKCDVLCDDCHREHHAVETRLPCGTARAYRRGCRCANCRAAQTARARDYRQRKQLAA